MAEFVTNAGNILVVDDDPQALNLMSRRLRRHDYDVDQAESGSLALERIGRTSYDAILLDIMTGSSGIETLIAIRKNHGPSDLPVIMVTAVPDDAYVVEALEAGANDYVAKSVDFRVLLARLKNHVALKRAEKDAADTRMRLEERVEERTRELRVSQRLLRTVFNAIPHHIFVKDIEGRYTMANKMFREFWKIPAENLVGAKVSILSWADEDMPVAIERHDRRIFEKGETVIEPEVTFQLKDGREVVRRQIKVPLLDMEGKIVGLVGISEDITHRRQTEEALRQAQKMEAVGQLTGGVAHDFNNLLQIIHGYTQIALTQKDLSERIVDHLQKVIEAAGRAANLTRQLLAFSRQSVLKPEYLDINSLLQNFEKMVRLLVGVDIDLEFRAGKNLLPVHVDPGTIEQVLLNLAINARDAMPKGGRLVIESSGFRADEKFCEVNAWESPGDYVEIKVSDTGVGMPPEVLEKIFDPFFTTKDQGKGTGLGLSMVYGSIEQHGGKILVYSEPGKGTTFRIYLPVADNASRDETEIAHQAVSGGNETILIAEDTREVLELVTKLLEGVGYQIISANNGLEALEIFNRNPENIDLIMLDVVMPRMGGREVYDQITKIRPETSILFTTGFGANLVDTEFLFKKKLTLIQKPYLPNELFSTVREMLDRRR